MTKTKQNPKMMLSKKTKIKSKTSLADVEIIENKLAYNGFVKIHVVTADTRTIDNRRLEITREVHDHGNVVTLLAADKKRQKVLLIGQWRIPAWLNGHKARLWEVIAGLIDPGESAEEAAKREALEETGYEISNLRLVCEAFSSPGIVTEKFSLFLADYDKKAKRNHTHGLAHEGEDIELKEFTFNQVFKMAKKGEIVDAKTLLAIHALEKEVCK